MPDFVDYGYIVNGPPTNTAFGVSVPLTKFGSPLYGTAVQDIVMEVAILEETMVRIKVKP